MWKMWRRSQRWSIWTTGPECTQSQKNAGNCIFAPATCKLWASAMWVCVCFSSLNIYIWEGKRVDPPYKIICYHKGQTRTSNLKTNFLRCVDCNLHLSLIVREFRRKGQMRKIREDVGDSQIAGWDPRRHSVSFCSCGRPTRAPF